MKCGVGLCGHCQLGPLLLCRDGPVVDYDVRAGSAGRPGAVIMTHGRLAARAARRSPSGSSPPATAASSRCWTARTNCWRSPARCGSRTSSRRRRSVLPGPYDVSLVEGSITTADDVERIRRGPRAVQGPGHDRRVRHRRRYPGAAQLRRRRGVQRRSSTRSPQYIDTLATSTPISAHVPVDFELRGCPIDKRQLLEVISAFLAGRKPDIPDTSVCTECKRRGLTCVMVAHGTPCLGPVTHAGCGALCPAVRSRLLRLLRPDERRQPARADQSAARRAG